jgi:hypothetical protein
MTQWIQKMFEKIVRWQAVAVLAVPMLGLFGVFNFHPAVVPALLKLSGGVPPLDMQWAYGPQEITSLFSAYGIEGRQRYAIFLVADLLFAASYGLFFAALLGLLLRPLAPLQASRWNLVVLLPLFTAAADCVENISILALLGAYPRIPIALAYTASIAIITKWLLAGAGICAILIVAGLHLACRVRHRCVFSCCCA